MQVPEPLLANGSWFNNVNAGGYPVEILSFNHALNNNDLVLIDIKNLSKGTITTFESVVSDMEQYEKKSVSSPAKLFISADRKIIYIGGFTTSSLYTINQRCLINGQEVEVK